MSYYGIVAPIRVQPIPGLDKLKLGTIAGATVLTTLEDGTICVFFEPGGQLSKEHCLANNLYKKHPDTGEKMGGYFDEKGRVTVLKLKGMYSEGYAEPITALAWTGDISHIRLGDQIDTVNGHEICRKYIPKATYEKQMNRDKHEQKQVPKISYHDFKEHFDTPNLRFVLGSLVPGDELICTEKVHGTSGRTGHLKRTERPMPQHWFKTLLDRAKDAFAVLKGTYIPKQDVWDKVSGTRRTTYKTDAIGESGYYEDNAFRTVCHHKINPKKGETIYYEIVGFTSENGAPVMATHNIDDSDKSDLAKEIRKQYQLPITYAYGCTRTPENYMQVYVYRITQMDVNGDIRDLSWNEVKQRCGVLGLKPVVELARIQFKDVDDLYARLRVLSAGASTLDPSHPMEGMCIRRGNKIWKFKTNAFCMLEGIRYNDPTYVDTEDVS